MSVRASVVGAVIGTIALSAPAAASNQQTAPPTAPPAVPPTTATAAAAATMPLTPPRPITDNDMSLVAVEVTLYALNEPGTMLDSACPIVQADRVNARLNELGMAPSMTGYRVDVRPVVDGPAAVFCGPDPATAHADAAAPFVVELSAVSLGGTLTDYVQGGGLTEPVTAHPDVNVGGEFVIHCDSSDTSTACLGIWGHAARSTTSPEEDLGTTAIEVLVSGPAGQVDSDTTFALLTGLAIDAALGQRSGPDGTALLSPPAILPVEATPDVRAVAQGALDATTAQVNVLLAPSPESIDQVAATHVAGSPEEQGLNEVIETLQSVGATVVRSPDATIEADVETVELIDAARATASICVVEAFTVVDSAGAPLGDELLKSRRYWYDMRLVDGAWRLNDSALTGEFAEQTTCAGAPATPLVSFADSGAPTPPTAPTAP